MANATADVYIDNITAEADIVGTTLQGKNTVILETSIQGKNTSTVATEITGKNSIQYEYDVSSLVKSAHIVADVTDHMVEGTFEFDGALTGGIYSGNYWDHVEYRIPDYNGVMQPVFVGMFPDSQTRYGATTENETLKGYDFSWYLTQNPLADPDLVLLTPDHQATITRYQLEFDDQQHWFQVGHIVTGGTTGHVGRVVEVVYGVFDALILENPTGIFQDNEELQVGGTKYALADGHAVDVTGTVDVINPEDWVTRALGGADWDVLYGVEPYRIASTSGVWGGTKPAIDFAFTDEQSIHDAILEPTAYLEYIFFPSWRGAVGEYQTPCAYWVPGTAIDDPSDGLDLPAAVTITSPDPYLVSVDVDQKGVGSYNRVTCRCRLTNGSWYTKTIQSASVDDRTERVREKRETNKYIATTGECDARCTDLYAYYNMQTITWKAVFQLRSDFRRLQKLTFSGYVSKDIPDGDYRILRIEYDYGECGTVNTQTVTLIADAAYKTYLSLNRSFTDTIREIQAFTKDMIEKERKLPEIGTVSTVDGVGGVTFASEQGLIKSGIDANP